MTRKTPEEIEAMALLPYPVSKTINYNCILHDLNKQDRIKWIDGYTSNTELEDFKKELVEKVDSLTDALKSIQWMWDNLSDQVNDNDRFNIPASTMSQVQEILDLITQEDQPEGGKEEIAEPKMILCPQCNKLRPSKDIKKFGMCWNCHY
jgi:hypothetical protein